METGKEDVIIESAIAYIKKYGTGFSTDDLCAAISKRTFYIYFSTKNLLIEKIMSSLIDKWKSECAEKRLLAKGSKSATHIIFLRNEIS